MTNTKTEYVYVCKKTTSKGSLKTKVFRNFVDVCFYIKKQHNKNISVYVLEINEYFASIFNCKELAEIIENSKSMKENLIFILNKDEQDEWVIDEMIGDLDKHILDLNFKLVPVETVD